MHYIKLLAFILTDMSIIYIAIFCHGTSLKKKNLATWGLQPESPVSVNRHAMLLTIMYLKNRCIMHDGLEHSMSVD